MNIGELIERIQATRPDPHDDLLNGPHRLCSCEKPCGGHMPKDPSGRQP